MSPQEAVDFLVERVGHERENALAEVRRSFAGDYGALYQMAYMMGGLQFYNLQRDLVGSKKMTNRTISRRDFEGRFDSRRNGSGDFDKAEIIERFQNELAVLSRIAEISEGCA